MWGEDSGGTDEPYTVLERTDGEQLVRIAKAGYAGAQGGFAQATQGYIEPTADPIEVDGKPALFWPGDDSEDSLQIGWRVWPQLAVDEGDDLAVTVSGEGLARAELEAIYRSTASGGGQGEAPAVADPPDGYTVVGSVDAQGVLATDPSIWGPDQIPGGQEAHGAAWRRGSQQLVVVTIPGRSMSLEALARMRTDASTIAEISGRDGQVRVTAAGVPEAGQNTVYVQSPWGDIVVAMARDTGGVAPTELLTTDDLVELVAGVQTASAAEWESFVTSANGGPGLHADVGRTELARGEIHGIGWLLQTGYDFQPPAQGGNSEIDEIIRGDASRAPDGCLKLSTGSRSCDTSGGQTNKTLYMAGSARDGIPEFMIIETMLPAATVRLTDPEGTVTTQPMVDLADGQLHATVLFGLVQLDSRCDHASAGHSRSNPSGLPRHRRERRLRVNPAEPGPHRPCATTATG